MKKYIFLPLYRSFGFRYLISSGLIKNLAKRFTIVVFIDIEKRSFYEPYFDGIDVIYENLDTKKIDEKKNSIFFDFIHILKKFICGQKKNYNNNSVNMWKIKFKEEIKKKKFFAIYFLGFLLRNLKILRKLFLIFEKLIDPKNIFNHYFEKYRPKAVILTSYGYDYDQYFVRDAKKFQCKSISIIYSWDNPTSKGYKSSDSDLYLVWNKIMRDELNIFHDIPNKKIKICGVSHWDIFFNQYKDQKILKDDFYKENSINKKNKVILFFSSAPRDFKNSFKIIDSILEKFKNNDSITLVARMHPHYMDDVICNKYLNNKSSFFIDQLKKKFKEKLIFKNPKMIKFGKNSSEVFYPAEDIKELTKLYSSANLFINEYSTTQLEACIFNIPIINAAIGNYRNTEHSLSVYEQHHHLWNLKKYKFTKNIEDYNELHNVIKTQIDNPEELEQNRKKFVDIFLENVKGKGSENIINNINDLI